MTDADMLNQAVVIRSLQKSLVELRARAEAAEVALAAAREERGKAIDTGVTLLAQITAAREEIRSLRASRDGADQVAQEYADACFAAREQVLKNVRAYSEELEKRTGELFAAREAVKEVLAKADEALDSGEPSLNATDLKFRIKDQIKDAVDEAVGERDKLLREIAEDATDGPINRGLNSVQAVLEHVAALDARERQSEEK